MTLAITHPFVSGKSDGPDPTLVQPSSWNADHSITMATSVLLGRLTSGAGDAEELSASDVAEFLKAALLPLMGTPTGAVQDFMLADAPAGWVKMTGGTIGDASSSATLRADDDTSDLFAAMWALDATVSAIQTSAGAASTRGATAADDFAAHKRIVVPDAQNFFRRGLPASGRLLGSTQDDALGSHTHTATAADNSHSHTGTAASAGAHTHSVNLGSDSGAGNDGVLTSGVPRSGSFPTNSAGAHTHSVTTSTNTHTHVITVAETGDTETRPANIAMLTCIKL